MKRWSNMKPASRRFVPLYLIGLTLGLILAATRPVSAGDFTITSASASSSLWPATNLYDGNTLTCWSSNTHASAGFTEWFSFGWSGMQTTNYVKLMPRYIIGIGEQANGPDKLQLGLAAGQGVETGRFYVYDTDGATLLYKSPTVAMRQGDIWNYTAGY